MKVAKGSVFVAALAALALSGCAYDPYQTSYPGPGTTYPTYPTYPTPEIARYGYVEAIDTLSGEPRQAQGPGVGAIGGAIAGGILGHQVGRGSRNTAATIGGAVIGGVVGHQVEQRVRDRQAVAVEYVFRVRMDDGSYQTFRKETYDGIQVGDRVRVERGNIFRV